MAGQPKARARREAEALRRSGKHFDRATRLAILERSEEVGAGLAAREVGISPGTLRTWRKRFADEPEVVPVLPSAGEVGSPAERLRAAAERARVASSRALDSADSMLARGLASESRNAAVVANVHAERAQELEASARLEEEHEVKLTAVQGRQVLDLIDRAFTLVDLPVPHSLFRHLLSGEEPDTEAVERARTEVRRVIAGKARAELLQQMEAERPPLSAGEVVDAELVVEDEPDDHLPSWVSLPDDFKVKYDLNRRLGRVEYERHVRRQERARTIPALASPRSPDFRHPGW